MKFPAPVALAALTVLGAGLDPPPLAAQGGSGGVPPSVRVVSDTNGWRMQIDGRDTMLFGMNWDWSPIGTNYVYDLFKQPDDVIEEALARDMPLLRNMGVNAIRVYVGIPPRWVRYIYERYGIYTMINHPMARYGFTLDGVWIPNVDYADPRLRAAVKAEIVDMVRAFQGTPGVLMWLLGNENNYGLSWTSFEIEALPEGERDAARARHLYSLFEEVAQAVKQVDPHHPVAIANGDVQYIDIIAQECKSVDVFGTNVYRGISARDLFEVVRDKLGVPVMFTEFGADAWNARTMREDQVMQARYLVGQWEEIYEQSSGKGRVGNAVGGFVFQWSDGWWKYKQDSNLDVHDTHASWPNAGYPEDYIPGGNNMNEEWWGITAKGPADHRGLYDVYPRAAYYALKRAWALDPYAPRTDLATIRAHFQSIDPTATALEARGERAAMLSESLDRVRVRGARLEFETFNTGGKNVSTPSSETPSTTTFPSFRGFDRMQSFYADIEARPSENVIANLSVNVLGHVAVNPIDEIFYENRGRPRTVQGDGQSVELNDIERVKVYRAGLSWDDRWFDLQGFYRTGHFHWGYEGDFFGLYQEANYGENIDIYNGEAPVGVELNAKRSLEGLTLAFGPELWWGANPAFLGKYRRQLGRFDAAVVYHEDLARQTNFTSSIAVPLPKTRRVTLQFETGVGPFGVQVGGIWGGSTKLDDRFEIHNPSGGRPLQDSIRTSDTFGFKAKVTWERGRWHWYAQGARQGVVADGGPTAVLTFTGWRLKDSGSGNQSNFLTGLAANFGNWQIAPNFLWQKPIIGPMIAGPNERLRNVLDDPFAVLANRETVGAELLISYDPTPATWMWAWDNILHEDARLAASLGFVYRDFHTTRDAFIGILADGRTPFAFAGSTPARELWELHSRIVSRIRSNARLVANLFAGTGEPNGDDPRLIHRYGGDARLVWGPVALETAAKFGDWGPYDYHRNFNLTFPASYMADVSYSLGSPRWFGFPNTRFGVRGAWRSLDEHSPRWCPGLVPGPGGTLQCDIVGPNGNEWEVRTYLHFAL